MAILTVSNLSDSGDGSLRSDLNSASAGDTIVFDPSLAGGTLSLTSGTLNIGSAVTIDGGNNNITVSGSNNFTDFNVETEGGTTTLENLTIADGKGVGTNGPIPNSSGSSAAGGIYSSGDLNLSNVTFNNNTATGGNGGNAGTINGSDKAAGSGGDAAGAVYVPSGYTVTASNLTFSNDTATAGTGGAPDTANPTPGANGTAYPISNSAAVATACYVTGTLIRTSRGDIAVEDLAIGDLAVTGSGLERPIKWIGHRVTQCGAYSDPQVVWPIRVAAHAFGENRPAADLLVSPQHAICVDVLGEVLIPASALLNGSTITQVEVDTVTYWHIELESHDVILANGLPAESYLELGNRSFFAESSLVALDAVPDAPFHTEADYCRPLIRDGAIIAAVQERLRARALAMGWTFELGSDPDLRILADGKVLRPEVAEGCARFVLPAEAKAVWLVSRTFQPGHFGSDADTRMLGVRIKSIAIGGSLAERRKIDAADASLSIGFHTVEQEASGECFRWTAGRALLPSSLWVGCTGQLLLQVAFDAHQYGVWAKPACIYDDVLQVAEAA